jgi:hypothetical protein
MQLLKHQPNVNLDVFIMAGSHCIIASQALATPHIITGQNKKLNSRRFSPSPSLEASGDAATFWRPQRMM